MSEDVRWRCCSVRAPLLDAVGSQPARCLLARLASSAASCTQLMSDLAMSETTIRRHLRGLEAAGWVERDAVERVIVFRVIDAAFRQAAAELQEVADRRPSR